LGDFESNFYSVVLSHVVECKLDLSTNVPRDPIGSLGCPKYPLLMR
jgi:hypothetical protein